MRQRQMASVLLKSGRFITTSLGTVKLGLCIYKYIYIPEKYINILLINYSDYIFFANFWLENAWNTHLGMVQKSTMRYSIDE